MSVFLLLSYTHRSSEAHAPQISGVEALKICPEIKLVHVATWAAGSTSWSYSDSPDMANSKSCLDPYRGESKKILAVLREVCKMTEKASIDESFLDLSGDIYERLIKEYPQLREEDREWEEEYLPMPPRTKLEWHGSHLVEKDKLPDEEEEEEDVDWDDVVMSMAAQIVADARKKVFDRLGYTCSAGIASNKMMAKLGAGYKKPNQQVSLLEQNLSHELTVVDCRQAIRSTALPSNLQIHQK